MGGGQSGYWTSAFPGMTGKSLMGHSFFFRAAAAFPHPVSCIWTTLVPVHNFGANRPAVMTLSWGVRDAHEAFSTILGSMREMLSPLRLQICWVARGCVCEHGPSGASLSVVGPSTRQHHPLVATSTCCTRVTGEPSLCLGAAKPSLSHCQAIAVPLSLASHY